MRASERLGAPAGAIVGVLVAIGLAWLVPATSRLGLAPAVHLFILILVAELVWIAGVLFGRSGRERAGRRALVAAIDDLSAAEDEPDARRRLFGSLARIAPVVSLEVCDEAGGVLARPGRKRLLAHWRSGRRETAPNVRPLQADGRDLGQVRWRFAGAFDRRGRDEIAAAVIELGAAAIVRARLKAEKAEMEDVVRTEHLRTVLLDAVSHHFRSPLAGILGSVTTLLDLPEPQDRRVRTEFLLIIKEQANRLNRYVENFLSLARLEAGSIEVNISEISLEPLIYDVWDTFGELGGARRYLQVDAEVETIRSDPRLLAQALGNVLENAIKYSPEASLVEVRVRRDGAWLQIEVADQGHGAPEASLTRMFDRFYRSQAVSAPGIGLGLYITRSIARMLGGDVAASNRPGDGAGLIVAIRLPFVEVAA